MADKDTKLDDLAKAARAAQEAIEYDKKKAAAVKAAATSTPVGQFMDEITKFNRTMSFLGRIYVRTKEIYVKLEEKLGPVGRAVKKVRDACSWAWNKTGYYKPIEAKMDAYVAAKTEGKHKYITKLARGINSVLKAPMKLPRAVMIWAMLAVGIQVAGMLPVIGHPIEDMASTVLIEPVYDATRMTFLYHKDVKLYVNTVSEFNGKDSEHGVSACKDAPGCDSSDAIYIRVKPSFMHWAWNLAVNHSVFYNPGQITAPMAQGKECTVTYYGARWRLTKHLQAYPYLLNASCTPITAGFNNSAGQVSAAQQPQVQTPVTVPQAPAMTN